LNAISLTARQELEKDHIVVSVFHPKMTSTNFGKNSAWEPTNPEDRPASPDIQIDTAEDVAKKIVEQIRSGAPEARM